MVTEGVVGHLFDWALLVLVGRWDPVLMVSVGIVRNLNDKRMKMCNRVIKRTEMEIH